MYKYDILYYFWLNFEYNDAHIRLIWQYLSRGQFKFDFHSWCYNVSVASPIFPHLQKTFSLTIFRLHTYVSMFLFSAFVFSKLSAARARLFYMVYIYRQIVQKVWPSSQNCLQTRFAACIVTVDGGDAPWRHFIYVTRPPCHPRNRIDTEDTAKIWRLLLKVEWNISMLWQFEASRPREPAFNYASGFISYCLDIVLKKFCVFS